MPKLRLASALLIPPPGRHRDRRAAARVRRRDVRQSRRARDPRRADQRPRGVARRRRAVMRDAAAATPGPLTLTFGPARSFHPDSPVLYLAVDGDLDELTALRAAMRTGPFEREGAWPFVPHVTIGTDLSEDRLRRRRRRADRLLRERVAQLTCMSCRSSGIRTRCADGDRSPTPALGGRSVSGPGWHRARGDRGCRVSLDLDGPSPRDASSAKHGAGSTASVARLAWLAVAPRPSEASASGAGCSPPSRTSLDGRARRCSSPRPPESLPDFLRARGWRDEGDVVVRDV